MKKLILAAAFLGAATTFAHAEDVVIGAIVPLSGASATIGSDLRRGIDLAVEQVNTHGGVLGGRNIKVIVEDSGGRPPSALDAAKKLVAVDNVPIVMGEFSSGITIPIGEYLKQEGRVHFNITSTSNKLRDLGGNSFGLIGLDGLSTSFAAKDVLDHGWKKAAVIVPNNAYGQGIATGFEKAFKDLGGTVTSTVLYTEGQTTYRRELQQLEQSSPDVYVYSAYGREAGTINRESLELGLNASPWYGVYLSMMVSDSDPAHVEGQIGFDVNYVGPNGKAYETLYQQKYGEPFISTFNGYAYDAVMLSAAAINKAQSTDPAKIAAAVREIGPTYEGVTGEIKLDANGQRSTQPYAKYRYDHGLKLQ